MDSIFETLNSFSSNDELALNLLLAVEEERLGGERGSKSCHDYIPLCTFI